MMKNSGAFSRLIGAKVVVHVHGSTLFHVGTLVEAADGCVVLERAFTVASHDDERIPALRSLEERGAVVTKKDGVTIVLPIDSINRVEELEAIDELALSSERERQDEERKQQTLPPLPSKQYVPLFPPSTTTTTSTKWPVPIPYTYTTTNGTGTTK